MAEGNSAARVIVSGARATAFGFAVRFGAKILFLYVAARLFGVALFGAFSIAVAVIELAVAIGGLGAKRALFKRIEDEQAERAAIHVILDTGATVAVASMVLAAAIMLGVAFAPAGLIGANVATATMALAPAIVGQALLDLVLAGTRWTHAIRYEVTSRSIVEPYLGVAASVVAYLLGYRETGLLIGYWAGTLAALGYALFGLRRCFGGFRLAGYRFAPHRGAAWLRFSAGATANDALNGLFGRIDIYLVGIFLGEAPAGVYGMARQVRSPVRQVRQAFDGLLNPIIARTLALKGPIETAAATASAARLILAVQLPILIVLALVGAPLLRSFGPGFDAGYHALLILAAAEAIQGAFGVSDLILLYRRPWGSLAVVAANIAFNLAAGLLLIGQLGVTGAAVAVLVGVVAGAVVRRTLLRRYFGVKTSALHSAGPAAAAAVAVGTALAVQHWLLPSPSTPLAYGASAAIGLIGYALALRVWTRVSGETLSLVNFQAALDPAPPSTLDDVDRQPA